MPNSYANKGRVGTHEVRHYLNLAHIWGYEETCNSTDYVDDTPTSKAMNWYCPDNTTNSCHSIDGETNKDLRDMYENFIDYTSDECKFIFTEEQVWRMRSVLSPHGCRRHLYYQRAILEGNQTLQPSSPQTTTPRFTCNSGCMIPESWVNDQYCDCQECEDEEYFHCPGDNGDP